MQENLFLVADNTVKSITLSNNNTVMAEKSLPASQQTKVPAGSSGVCCNDYSKTSNSCVCGCSTSPYCTTTSSGQIIFWVLGAILVAVIAIVLTSLLLRRTHKKSQTKGESKKE